MSQNLADWVKTHSKNSGRKSSAAEEIRLIVRGVASDGNAAVLGRLGDLGLASGEAISYFGVAPLGEPIYINVRETVIALRLNEARLIDVSEDRPEDKPEGERS
jgi:Fe2+ transport system protein FeoA